MASTPSRAPSVSGLAVTTTSPPDTISELKSSSNSIAAGIGEAIHALFSASSHSQTTTPIMIDCGERVMALGRKRMGAMNGRNAFLYLKSKFGLLSTSAPLYLSASFTGSPDKFVEVDMDAWEELVPYIEKLRIVG
ncbi:hypothetical protein FA15DRAFT_670027 [Coprinopsis marcescibilis]|uniref:Uncharacterized protein n=1 Tax=Coprinopsis marcescibilis TaxID=230819 RepID=A0A5C3KUS6_COPMA|nr:hypothetical protein FA15DRAFT_670027 [Coprinopsis marcescibilis]